MRTIWGFDLGVASVGFAVLRWNEVLEPYGSGEILRLGVRVFAESRDNKLAPLNADRRKARLTRRQVRRRRWRRVHLRQVLAGAGLLAGDRAVPLGGQDPYALRALGLTEPLSCTDLGWALFHLLKRRGFTGSRKYDGDQGASEADRKKAEKEERETTAKRAALRAELGNDLLATHLVRVTTSVETPRRRRDAGHSRDMVAAELDALWRVQSQYHPGVLTEEFRSRLEDIALSQRPTFFRRRTIGRCDLEPDEDRALKAHWLTQRFEALQLINGLRLEGGNRPGLDATERTAALDYLEATSKPTWAGLRRAIGLPRDARFSHERGKKDTIRGNATEAALRAALGSGFPSLPAASTIREAIGQAWHRIEYRPAKGGAVLEIRPAAGIREERGKLATRAVAEWGLSEVQAQKLAAIELPYGTGRHSLKAMRRLLPLLEAGAPYMTALQQVYAPRESADPLRSLPGPNPSEVARIADPFVRQRMESLLAGIRNPTVLRTLGELQRVVNTLLRVHGRPDLIRVEMSRDLKQSAKERREVDSAQSKREKSRADARDDLVGLGKVASGREGDVNVARLLLWREQAGRCPFTGDMISCADALNAEATEIEHLFPRSRSFDTSQANTVLCFRRDNREKGARTPHEWLSPQTDRWRHLSETVWPQMEESGWPRSKRQRCAKPDLEQPDDPGFTNRQMVDTAFTARAARDYLGLLYGGGQTGMNAVQPVPGRGTAQLRRAWGIGLGHLLGTEPEGAPKSREDHRHHAVDALAVALTGPATVRTLSSWWQIRETTGTRPAFQPPWKDFRSEARAWVEEIVVSHRVQAKLSGPLHEETRLSDTGEEVGSRRLFVKRKPLDGLSPGNITAIRDAGVRAAIEAAVVAAGGDRKKALASEIRLPRKDGSPGPVIRRVRLCVPREPDAMVRTHAHKNIYAETAPGSLHHIAIYEDGGTVRFLVTPKRDAALRMKQGRAVAPRVHPEGGRLLMVLHPGDVLASRSGNPRTEMFVIRKFSTSGQIFFKPLTMTEEPRPEVSKRPGPLVREGWRKVVVDPIGRVAYAR
jgi:CRISPR-associated endonuclease Csn1